MDNFQIMCRAESFEELKSILSISINRTPGKKAEYWSEDEEHGLILYWSSPGKPEAQQFQPAVGAILAATFIWSWLKTAKYPESDWSDDVWAKKGWEASNDYWGHAGGSPYGFIAIKPALAYYGK